MSKKIYSFLIFLSLAGLGYAGLVYNPMIHSNMDMIQTIEEEDGAPTVPVATIIKVPNSTLTDNADGTVSLDFGVVNDDNFNIYDGTDSTKIVTFQADQITTETTRILTIPDSNGVIVVDATECTDLEGTGLAITAGTLNWTAASTDLSDTANIAYLNAANAFTNVGDNTFVGNVGIGTTTPIAKLNVKSGTDVEVARFEDESGNISVIDKDGNVGIGTTVPGHQFVVSKTSGEGIIAAQRIQDFGSDGADAVIGSLRFLTTDASSRDSSTFAKIDVISADVGAGSSSLRFFTSQNGPETTLYEQMRIDPSGNVGIGKTSPNSKLSVNGGISVGANYNVAAPSNGAIIEGNVGIGTTAPSRKLQIEDADGEDNMLSLIETTGVTTGSMGRITFGNSDVDDVLSEIRGIQDGATDAGALTFRTEASGAGGAEAMRITSDGNVGIGTTTPSALLEVSGAGQQAIKVTDISNSITTGMWAGTDQGLIGTLTDTDLRFVTNGDSKMTIDKDGNVGIGVTDPDTILEVFGSTGLKISFDGTDNTTLVTDTNGDLTITPSGGDVICDVTGALTGNADTVTSFTPASGSITLSGADALTITTTGDSNSTLPLGTKTLVATDVTTLSSLTSVGTITSLVATTADINAGTVDATIGGTTPAAGTFTTLVMNTGLAANLKMFADAAGTGTEWASGMKIGTFSRDTTDATGTQAISGVGFKPSHIIFISAVEAGAEVSMGFDDGTTHLSMVYRYNSTWATQSFISIFNWQAAAIYYRGTVSVLGADGFTISWTKTGLPTGTLDVYYMAFR